MNTSTHSRHPWRFFRAGGFDQVRLDTGADLTALDQLDQKLWVALACPTRGIEFDAKTLDLIDTDKDGRIRPPELIAAVRWAASMLKNPDDLTKGSPSIPLAALNDATPEGKSLLASARQILANLGRRDATQITLEDTSDTARIFADTRFNGDGIVPAEAADDESTRALIKDIVACLGTETDRSGKPGVSQATVDRFFADAAAYSEWVKRAETDAATVLPFGDASAGAAATFTAVRSKVDDYFARCRLAAFDSRALAAVNRPESEYLSLAAKDLSLNATEVAGFPLAHVQAGRPLPLKDGLNPAWADAIAKLHAAVIQPLLGDKAALTEADWTAVSAKVGAHLAWAGSKAGAPVEKLGVKRLREILASRGKETLASLLAKDKALEPEANAVASVDKLIRFHRDLYKLLNNFVSFRDFYGRRDRAIFQAGTLYLDQRSCDLCLTVEDAGRHASMAGLAGAYLAYLDCVRKSTGQKLNIVAVFSQGDDDNLMIGRNGVFYDRQGRDYDATITKIVSNPISLRQAFWSPYKKFVRMIEEQVAKRAAAAEAASDAKLAQAAAATAQADKAKPAEPKKVDVGTVAALGVAFGAIGAFFTALVGHLVGVISMGPLAIVGLLVGVIALISGPSMILAFIKLRKRNLGPVLDANGWAVNARARLNVPFGASLTGIAKLPPGAARDLADPFAEKRSPWPKLIVLALVLYLVYLFCDRGGYIHQWTQGRFGTAKTLAVPTAATLDAPKPVEPAK